MVVTHPHNVILRVNHAFTNMTGYSAENAIGQKTSLRSSDIQNKAFYTAIRDTINSTGLSKDQIQGRRKNNEVYPEHLHIKAVKNSTGIVTNYLKALTKITSSKAASNEIERLAFNDPLTQLPNRRLFPNRLNQALAVSAHCSQLGTLLFLDLDHFKNLNDTLGEYLDNLLLQ
jgi:PAS domain S-box-containing protein